MAPDRTTLLRAVDRAALAASFGERLRRAGASVPTTALADLCEALGQAPRRRLDDLYWSMRVTLVRRQPDLDTFDRVFAAAFRSPTSGPTRTRGDGSGARTAFPPPAAESAGLGPGCGGVRTQPGERSGCPWHTLPRSTRRGRDEHRPAAFFPELLPSALSGDVAHRRSTSSTTSQLAALGRLARARPLPAGRTRGAAGCGQVAAVSPSPLRQTIAASRRTGWEPLDLRRQRRVQRPSVADPGHRRERLDAVVLGGLPAPHAGLRPDRPRRDVRLLDVADSADSRAGSPLGRHRPGSGRGARRRPVRRHPPARVLAGPAGLAARIEASRRAC